MVLLDMEMRHPAINCAQTLGLLVMVLIFLFKAWWDGWVFLSTSTFASTFASAYIWKLSHGWGSRHGWLTNRDNYGEVASHLPSAICHLPLATWSFIEWNLISIYFWSVKNIGNVWILWFGLIGTKVVLNVSLEIWIRNFEKNLIAFIWIWNNLLIHVR